MEEHDHKQLETYARLVEAVIMDAFLVCRRASKKEEVERVIEFAKREPNPLLSEYCGAFEISEERVRQMLTARAEEALEVI